MKFILASQSPRRRQLLEILGHQVTVILPDVDESSDGDPQKIARLNARLKAEDVFNRHGLNGADLLIGADTIVVLAERVIGKPKSPSDACRILSQLSGQTHHVVTAFCLMAAGNLIKESQVMSAVSFRQLTDVEIDTYVKSHEGMDKAGAYGVQGAGAALLSQINGSITNIIGLPVEELLNEAHLLIERCGTKSHRA